MRQSENSTSYYIALLRPHVKYMTLGQNPRARNRARLCRG